MNQPVTLVLGGARSGKSAFAEGLLEDALDKTGATYIATAELIDDEMKERVSAHRARRGTGWDTLEVPLHLAPALVRASASAKPLLVDCLTVWLGNLMHHGLDPEVETLRIIDALEGLEVPVVFVASEVGLGLVPETPLGRRFRDHQGKLNQAIAGFADEVYFVCAGLPLRMKPQSGA